MTDRDTKPENVPDKGAHRLDAPEGPTCACGRPSMYESGWCGEEHEDDSNAEAWADAADMPGWPE